MNKIITIFLIILIVLGFLNNIIEYIKSKTTSVRKFEHNSFRHFSHLFMPLVFFIISIWIFLKISNELSILLNLTLGFFGVLILLISLVPFYLYFNYLLNKRVDSVIYNAEVGKIVIDGQLIQRNLIQHVIWHKVQGKSPILIWSNFEFVELKMRDGTIYILTSLLLNLKILHKYFHKNPVTYSHSLIPRVK